MMMHHKKTFIRLLLTVFVTSLALIIPSTTYASAPAASPTSAPAGANITQAVTQSYNANTSIQLGMIVQLDSKDPTYVDPLVQSSINNMLGIVVSPNESSVTLTPQTTTHQQVFVATAGRYNVLVSDQNGAIRAGDLITISSLAGIGMKADQNQAVVLGKAAGSFNGTSNVVSTLTLTGSKGEKSKVALGMIPIDLNIAHNPLASKQTDYVPSFLAKTATAIASKPVSAARIYLGLLTLFASSLLTGNLLYSGVRNGMQAIGRNPLSKKSIIRSLIQTVIAGMIIFIVGIFAVYLLLKL